MVISSGRAGITYPSECAAVLLINKKTFKWLDNLYMIALSTIVLRKKIKTHWKNLFFLLLNGGK